MHALRSRGELRHVLPDLVGGKAQHGSHQPQQRLADPPQRSLRRKPLGRRAREGVQPVLQHIKVHGAQVHGKKLIQALVDAVEEHLVVPAAAFVGHVGHAQQHVLVHRLQPVEAHRVLRRTEAVEVTQYVAEGVANLAVVLRDSGHQVLAGAHVLAEVHAGHPEAHNLSTHALGNVHRVHGVAQALAHGAAVFIQSPSIRRHRAIRRNAVQPDRAEQRRVEPSAVLVAALKIHIGGLPLAVDAGQHARLRGATLKPHVNDVHLLAELRATAVGALASRRENLRRAVCVPGIRALAGKQLLHGAVRFLGLMQLVALRAEEDRNRHAPQTLTADAPVRSRGHHVGNALFAPRRIPLHAGDGLQSLRAQSAFAQLAFHADEPLLRGAEDYRLVAAPAVRIAVLNVLAPHQHAASLQQSDDRLVGHADLQALVLRQPVVQHARLVHVAGGVQPVLHASVEVIRAVRRSGVHRARARVHGHVVGHHAKHIALQKRMRKHHAFHLRAHKASHHIGLRCRSILLPAALQVALLDRLRGQFVGHNVNAAIAVQRHILRARIKRHGQRCRQRPRRRRPDDCAHLVRVGRQLRSNRRGVALQLVFHIHRRRDVVLVLHFGFGQRRAVVDAPPHRLQALVHHPFFQEGIEVLDDLGLVPRRHRRVGVREISKHSQPLELIALRLHPLRGILAAGLANLKRVHLELFAAQLLVHLVFNRQAVAVPARHVRRIEASHRLRLHDEVLQTLVQRVAKMNRPVGVRRSVVQHPSRRALTRLSHQLINANLLPVLQHTGLVLRQVCLHRKIGLGKIDGCLQVHAALVSTSSG